MTFVDAFDVTHSNTGGIYTFLCLSCHHCYARRLLHSWLWSWIVQSYSSQVWWLKRVLHLFITCTFHTEHPVRHSHEINSVV